MPKQTHSCLNTRSTSSFRIKPGWRPATGSSGGAVFHRSLLLPIAPKSSKEEYQPMKKQFFLEGERVTLKQVKVILGDERYLRVVRKAKAAFLAKPETELSYHTDQGIITIWFQPN